MGGVALRRAETRVATVCCVRGGSDDLLLRGAVVAEMLRGARVFAAFAVGRVRGPVVSVEVVRWSVVGVLGCCGVVVVSGMAFVKVDVAL